MRIIKNEGLSINYPRIEMNKGGLDGRFKNLL